MTLESSPTFKSAVVAPVSKLLSKSMRPQPLFQRSRAKSDTQLLRSFHPRGRRDPLHKSTIPTTVYAEKPAFVAPASATCHRVTWLKDEYHSLPEIPMFYPIERTNTIVICSNPRIIADRILSCLRKLSIAAKFNSPEASLFAETIDHIQFYVRLYKSNRNDGEILVEVQRAEGDSFSYIKHARAILASARGETIENEKGLRQRSSSLVYIPQSIVCHKNEVEKKCLKHLDVQSISHVEELLQKDRIDAVLLGMESLLLLTDSERSQVSIPAALAVLRGSESGPSVVKDFVHRLICCFPSNDFLSARENNLHDFATRQEEIMHNTALAVLANALQTVLNAKCPILSTIARSEEWMGDSGIIDALMSDLSDAKNRSHDAYQAARCFHTLVEASSEMKRMLEERDLERVLEESQAVGRTTHSLLADECEKALATLM